MGHQRHRTRPIRPARGPLGHLGPRTCPIRPNSHSSARNGSPSGLRMSQTAHRRTERDSMQLRSVPSGTPPGRTGHHAAQTRPKPHAAVRNGSPCSPNPSQTAHRRAERVTMQPKPVPNRTPPHRTGPAPVRSVPSGTRPHGTERTPVPHAPFPRQTRRQTPRKPCRICGYDTPGPVDYIDKFLRSAYYLFRL